MNVLQFYFIKLVDIHIYIQIKYFIKIDFLSIKIKYFIKIDFLSWGEGSWKWGLNIYLD